MGNRGNARTKSEYVGEVDSRPSWELADSPRKTPAPANRDLITQVAVNRRDLRSHVSTRATVSNPDVMGREERRSAGLVVSDSESLGTTTSTN